MGCVTILDYTTKVPLEMIGKCTGVCWNANIENSEKNKERALNCIESGHGRTLEFPDVYMIISGYSARVIRELYTHIGGSPTRLQASTRYIDYENKGFEYIIPSSIAKNEQAWAEYTRAMENIKSYLKILSELGIPREDCANLLPLGMTTRMVYKVNLRTLIDMSHQRECNRAYWEFRALFRDIEIALKEYSDQWRILVERYFKPKCEVYGYCTESNGCGKYPKKR